MPKLSIVTIAGDAGGAAALAPVLRRLRQDPSVLVNCYAYLQAPSILEGVGIPSHALTCCDVAQSRRALQDVSASLLLTGTSVNRLGLEKYFVTAARQVGCRSIGILDFWSNYAARFADADGNLTAAPDVLAVMDARARDALIAIGVNSELVITGQPAFDGLRAHRAAFNEVERAAVRIEMGASDSDCLVLFVSQALDDLYGDAPALLGFDQHRVRRLVIETLGAICGGRRPVLAIRKHPRETAWPEEHHTSIRITEDLTPHRWDAVMAADLVVGMNSALLLEASYLGAPVLSLQPGLIGDDALPSNVSGGTAAAYTRQDAVSLLTDYFLNDDLRRRLSDLAISLAPDGLATERVCECISKQLSRTTGTIV